MPINFFSRWHDPIIIFLLLFSTSFFVGPLLGKPYPEAQFSTPVLPLLGKAIAFATPLSFMQAINIWVALSFPLSSFTWHLLFKALSRNNLIAFLASLIFNLPWSLETRFSLFWERGDGAHSLAVVFLPIAGFFFWQFLKSGGFKFFVISFLGIALVSLTSPFGLLNLYIVFMIITASEMLLGQARIKLTRFLIVAIFAQGFSSFWYHPAFFAALFNSENGRAVINAFWQLVPIAIFSVPIIGAFSFLIFDRKPTLQPLFLGLVLTLIYFSLTAIEKFGGYLSLPVPDRFLPEFYLGLSLLGAILINFLINLPLEKKLNLIKVHSRFDLPHHAREVCLTTFLTAFLAWPIFSLFSATPVLSDFSQTNSLDGTQVLAAQTVWREVSSGGLSHYAGYGITILTGFSAIFLKSKIKN